MTKKSKVKKPVKRYPIEEKMYIYRECVDYIEKKYSVDTDARRIRDDSLWLWICDNQGDSLSREGCYILIPKNPEESGYEASEAVKQFCKLLHDEFAEDPEEEFLELWTSW